MINKFGKIIYNLVFFVLVIIAGLVAISTLKIPGNYQLFVVQSGSMEPAIKTGSIVIVKPEEKYFKNDVVTVLDSANMKSPVTHRIFSVEEATGGAVFQTKGDANNTPDTEKRNIKNVLGKVIFSMPFIGYPVAYAKTRDGLIFLVIIPVTIIIYSELLTIKNETVKLLKDRKKRKLTKKEKLEIEIGEEEIKIERWYHRILKRVKNLFTKTSTKKKK
jgi:signal peptidase